MILSDVKHFFQKIDRVLSMIKKYRYVIYAILIVLCYFSIKSMYSPIFLLKHPMLCKLLMDFNFRVDEIRDGRWKTIIDLAIEQNDTKIIKMFKDDVLQRYLSFNVLDENARNVKILLDCGVQIDESIAIRAWNYYNEEIFVILVKHGLNLNALRSLRCNSSFELSKTFLSSKLSGVPCTFLHKTMFKRTLKIAKTLISIGADVNVVDGKGRSPLWWACFSGYVEGAILLILNGADIDMRDRDGLSPIMAAVREGHDNIVELLIRYGANINEKDNHSRNLLHYVADRPSDRFINLLIAKCVDVSMLLNAKDDSGNTPLHIAVKCYNYHVGRFLVNDCCDVNITRIMD